MLKLGNKSISNLFIGQKAATKAFLGQKLVWQKATGLPYDAEVEYLESTGTQWIDTGVIALADDSYDLDFWMNSMNNSQTLFGAANDGARLATVWVTLGGAIRFGGGGTIAFDGRIWKVGDWNSLHSSYSTTILNGVSKVNSFPHPFEDASSTQNILLFKANGMPQTTIKIRISNLRWYQNGVLVRDMIPVRVGGVGYMYDRVSKQLFGNQGTGNFIVGPDVVEVEYLESTGTQWIDTGVEGKDGITANAVLIAQGATHNSCILGSYGSNGARCWLVYMFGNVWYIGYNAGSTTPSAVNVGTVYTVSSHITNSSFSLIVNGDIARTVSYSSGFTTGLSMYMFAMNTSSGANYKAKARVYECKIYDNGVLVRDFVPVRVGMEGAMMDKLTRKIYRNAGTGAFKFGADKKETPLMCNSYVKDGLVAMWDGTENAGWGTHDASATMWKDLIGNFDLTLGSASSWERNALYVASPVSKGAAFRDEVYEQSKVQTIEACFQVETGPNYAWIICINNSVSAGSENLCIIARVYSTEGIMRNAKKSTQWQRNYDANTITVTADTGYVNAVDLGSKSYANTFSNPECFCLFGRNGNTIYQPNKGRIYRCSIYSRALTAEEIAWNYEIDKRRFNLP